MKHYMGSIYVYEIEKRKTLKSSFTASTVDHHELFHVSPSHSLPLHFYLFIPDTISIQFIFCYVNRIIATFGIFF